jgi:hypothetical protein
MRAKPFRESIAASSNCCVDAGPGNAAEVVLDVRPARLGFCRIFLNYSKINRAHIVSACNECAPGRERITHAPQLERSREIISAAAGDDENGESEGDKLRKMTMNRAVSAEDNHYVGSI